MRPILILLGAAALAGCMHDPSRHGDGSAGYTLERSVRYSPDGWPQALAADLYRPVGRGPFPAVLMVHGGGWNGRDRSDMDRLSRRLATAGYVVMNVDYRLAPQHLYPAALEDMHAALRWLQANAARLGIDPQRIGGWGYSAGGHLVSLAAVRPQAGTPRLAAVVAGGTPHDLPHYPDSPIIRTFIGASHAQQPEVWREASPVTHVDRGDPPMFLYHGTWDRLVYFEDSQTMQRALQAAGVPVELHPVRGLGHVATFLLGNGATRAGLAFLDRHLAPAEAAGNEVETTWQSAQ